MGSQQGYDIPDQMDSYFNLTPSTFASTYGTDTSWAAAMTPVKLLGQLAYPNITEWYNAYTNGRLVFGLLMPPLMLLC